jgi:hypothetical protein
MSWTAGYERPGIAVELRPGPSSVFAPANALVGNPPGHATLGMAYVGPTLVMPKMCGWSSSERKLGS